jgi:hypothetical protein
MTIIGIFMVRRLRVVDEFIQHKQPLHNQWHKPDGPARLWNEGWAWWLHNTWHRYYGPYHSNGTWAIHGVVTK